ncbi:hypothetical protein PINS_up013396 [Pythium insidiosum]|nr:hypothetical protein PINS_up013396 [Pythium insidiosum]
MAVDAETRAAMGDRVSANDCDAAHAPPPPPPQPTKPLQPQDPDELKPAENAEERSNGEERAPVEDGAADAASDEPAGTKDAAGLAAEGATGGRADADATDHNRSPSRSDASHSSPDMLRVQPQPPLSSSRSHDGRPRPDEDEDVLPPATKNGKNFEISDLFTNAHLERKSAMVVLRKDPFCIPRATDPVTEYRPRFNPLNILVSEEKLLPRNFVIDFSEGIPGVPALDKKRSETSAPPRKAPSPSPAAPPTSWAARFRRSAHRRPSATSSTPWVCSWVRCRDSSDRRRQRRRLPRPRPRCRTRSESRSWRSSRPPTRQRRRRPRR